MNRYPRAIPAAIGIGIIMSAGGASPHEMPPTFPVSIEQPSVQPTSLNTPQASATPEAMSTYMGSRQKELLRLLGLGANINVIYVPVVNAVYTETINDEKDHYDFSGKLIMSDPQVLAAFTDVFKTASYDRYAPKANMTYGNDITLTNGCIDIDKPEEAAKVEAAAEAASIPGEVNVVALDAESCRKGNNGFVGYGATDIIPVIDRSAFIYSPYVVPQTYAWVGAHEIGHAAGLSHAGKATCEKPLTLTGCTVDDTGDQNSIMSYKAGAYKFYNVAYHFTAVALHMMGLLKKSEVVTNPAPGTINLVPMEQEGPKLIVVNKPNRTVPVYISTENDPLAAYDIVCDALSKSNQDRPYVERPIKNGKTYTCYESNTTGTETSVQVRYPNILKGAMESMVMVDTLPDPTDANDPRDNAYAADGYTNPNTPIFSDGTGSYKLGSFVNGEATIVITSNTQKAPKAA